MQKYLLAGNIRVFLTTNNVFIELIKKVGISQ